VPSHKVIVGGDGTAIFPAPPFGKFLQQGLFEHCRDIDIGIPRRSEKIAAYAQVDCAFGLRLLFMSPHQRASV
jgi:hypothetical protein